MEMIPETFEGKGEVKGWLFTRLDESDAAYLYSRESKTGEIYYEVITKRSTLGGERYIGTTKVVNVPKMIYPKSNQFGKYGWCFSDLTKAVIKFNSIITKVKPI
jgi:hypothetical protein